MTEGGADPSAPAAAAVPLALTYRELGVRLGLSPDGARALARRRGWAIAHDDAGRAMVQVSESELVRWRERRGSGEGEAKSESERSHGRSMAARVADMVAAIKAEPPPMSVSVDRSAERAERDKLIELMRQFLALYERERMAWFGAFTELHGKVEVLRTEMRALEAARGHERSRWETALKDLDTALATARAATHAAERQHEQALDQHRRALADLTVMHNDERSLWLLERRRLEMQIEALRNARARRGARRLPRPGMLLRGAAAALMVALVGTALVRDSAPERATTPGKIEHSEDRSEGVAV
ncbi:MAG TPA: hypothetical protein VGU20_24260 [Stellaceae bacterium]|nr:hypothetical protein [Stellaceae bacterium]